MKIKKASELNMKGLYKFEKWTELNNFENGKFKGLYKVSDMGRVYSIENNKILKPWVNNKGYFLVDLCKNGKQQHCLVHRLVATEFISNPENKPCIDHIDVNRKNNKINNLRWVTYEENMNNELSLAMRMNCKFMVIPYCILDDGTKIPLAVYKGLSQASREIQSFSENVYEQNIGKVLSKKPHYETCGKIKVTSDTSDITLAKIAIYELEGKKIYWSYLQDFSIQGSNKDDYLELLELLKEADIQLYN